MTEARFPDLEGASVFVTGGGSGIGAALTEGFLAQGSRVAFVQRSDGTGFADEMEERHGNRPLYIACDLTEVDQIRAAVTEAAAAHGDVAVLINNAGNDERHETLEVTPDYWDKMQAINLRAMFFAAQAVIPGMQKRGGGAIVNLSSISYMMGQAGYPAYVTANSGVNGLTRALAREFGRDRIRVNALAPGWVLTEKQLEMWATEEDLKKHADKMSLPEHLKPADMMGPALFLASEASWAVTGQALVADGGVVTTG